MTQTQRIEFKMKRSYSFRAVVAAATFAAGLAAACVGSSPNPDHCFNASGDETCVVLYGEERPFCTPGGESCGALADFNGCVAEPPKQECHSPCGGQALAAEDDSCLVGTDDTGTGDGDDGCGDGVIADDEECDDGNLVNDDECSNTCELATCGDGIVQEVLAETCDDGNTESGDACASSCVVAGTIIWERRHTLIGYRGAAVAIASNDDIGVAMVDESGKGRLVALNSSGDRMWNVTAPGGEGAVAVGPDNTFAAAGLVEENGAIWGFDVDGAVVYEATIPGGLIYDVGIDGQGSVIAAGSANEGGMRVRFSADGMTEWSLSEPDTDSYRELAVALDGRIWALSHSPPRVEHYSATTNEFVWATEPVDPFGSVYADLAANESGAVYLVRNNDTEGFSVSKIAPDGEPTWEVSHDDPGVIDIGSGIAPLPNGGAIVAGFTNSDGVNREADGLLSWFAPDGQLVQDVVLDAPQNDDPDVFGAIAVSPKGYAVAVGYHGAAGQSDQLWVVKFVI